MMDRSLLFVPGDRPERIEKAARSGADRVIIDLEDAVAPENKALARKAAGDWFATGREAAVRVNSIHSEWSDEDIGFVAHVRPSFLILPKAEDPDHIAAYAGRVGMNIQIVALIETASGVWNAHAIASLPCVARLAFGSIDFEAETGVANDHEAMLHVRSQLVLASAVARRPPPIDGVTLSVDDTRILDQDISHAYKLGFRGKLCIHPRQVEAVNRGLGWSDGDVSWALRVVAAAEDRPEQGAFQLEGKLVDRPVIERARRILLQRSNPRPNS